MWFAKALCKRFVSYNDDVFKRKSVMQYVIIDFENISKFSLCLTLKESHIKQYSMRLVVDTTTDTKKLHFHYV